MIQVIDDDRVQQRAPSSKDLRENQMDSTCAIRGLIQGRVALGEWKARLLANPTRLMEAYLARAQAAS